MARNIEVKVTVDDLSSYRDRAQKIADQGPFTLNQTDIFFAVNNGRLKLRLENNEPGQLIFYHRDDVAQARESNYLISKTDDRDALRTSLELACGTDIVVIKQRELYLVGQSRIHLDEVQGLGAFVEIEVVMRDDQDDGEGHQELDRIFHELELPSTQVQSRAYADMLREQAQTP